MPKAVYCLRKRPHLWIPLLHGLTPRVDYGTPLFFYSTWIPLERKRYLVALGQRRAHSTEQNLFYYEDEEDHLCCLILVFIDSQDFKLWIEVRLSFCSFFTGLFANSPLTRSQSSHNGSNCSSESLWVPRNKKTTFIVEKSLNMMKSSYHWRSDWSGVSFQGRRAPDARSGCLTCNVWYFSHEITIFWSVKIVSFLFINQLINEQRQTDNYNCQIRYFIFWCLRRPSRLTNSGPGNAGNCILESKIKLSGGSMPPAPPRTDSYGSKECAMFQRVVILPN